MKFIEWLVAREILVIHQATCYRCRKTRLSGQIISVAVEDTPLGQAPEQAKHRPLCFNCIGLFQRDEEGRRVTSGLLGKSLA